MAVIDYWLVSIYMVVVIALGLWAARKVDTVREFAIAGGRYGSIVVFCTLAASYIGGGFTMGNAREVYLFGIANVVAIWGFSIKELLVGWFLAPRMVHFPDAISPGDVTGTAYGTPAKVLTGVFGLVVCIAIVGAQVGAMGALFSYFLGIHPIVGIVIGSTILIVYSTFGGMRAVVVTDVLQFIMLGIGLPVTLVFGVMALGGVSETIRAVPSEHWQLFSNTTPLALASLFLSLMIGEALVPPYLQRLMIGNPKAVGRGTVIGGFLSIPFFAISGMIGLVAVVMNSQLAHPDQAIPFVVDQAVPWGVKGLVVAGLLSVSMSSADSFLNSAAVCLSHDVAQPLYGNKLSLRTELLLARWTTAIGGAAAVIFAVSIDGLLQILLYAYNFWAPVVLLPIVAALLGFKASWKVIAWAALLGVGANLFWSQHLTRVDGPLANLPLAGVLEGVAAFDGLLIGIAANGLVVFGTWFAQSRMKAAAP